MDIKIKQSGNRPTYTFLREWGLYGGNLYGNNFISDICLDETIVRAVKMELIDDIWTISSIDSDPDYLLYLWKKGRGEKFEFYISESEVLFLHEFYRINGFDMMLNEINRASSIIFGGKNKYCVVM